MSKKKYYKLTKKERIETVTKGYLEDSDYVTKGYLEDVGMVTKDYLEDVGMVTKDYLEDVGMVTKDYLEDVGMVTKDYLENDFKPKFKDEMIHEIGTLFEYQTERIITMLENINARLFKLEDISSNHEDRILKLENN